jgi:hypothetical protein
MKPIRSSIIFVSVLAMLSIWGFIAVYRAGYVPNGLDVGIFAIIVISGTYAFVTHMRRYQAEKVGLPPDDELSNLIKYKAGYYAFMTSMYIWLFIFLFKRYFPDVETMLGGGILLSAFVAIGLKIYLMHNYHENEN